MEQTAESSTATPLVFVVLLLVEENNDEFLSLGNLILRSSQSKSLPLWIKTVFCGVDG